MTIRARVEFITPDQARKILAKSKPNRNLRQHLWQAYQRDMDAGLWNMTGEAIQFNESGELINGQHRLTGLSRCTEIEGVSLLVVRGLPDEAQLFMDQGAQRTLRDMLKIEGGEKMKNSSYVAAIARWYTLAPVPDADLVGKLKGKVAVGAALETYREHADEMIRAGERAAFVRSRFPMSVSAIGYCYFLFHRLDPESTERYFWAFTDLSFGAQGDPRKAAYQRLTRLLADEDVKHGPLLSVATVSLLTRSWNLWRKAEEVDTIPAKTRQGAWIPPEEPI